MQSGRVVYMQSCKGVYMKAFSNREKLRPSIFRKYSLVYSENKGVFVVVKSHIFRKHEVVFSVNTRFEFFSRTTAYKPQPESLSVTKHMLKLTVILIRILKQHFSSCSTLEKMRKGLNKMGEMEGRDIFQQYDKCI